MMKLRHENKEEKTLETVDMVNRLFPFKNEEDLKIYAILSTRKDLSLLINNNTAQLILACAYSMDGAIVAAANFVKDTYPDKVDQWSTPVMVTSMAFQQMVPIDKITEMVEKIAKENGAGSIEKSVEQMESYVKYILNIAEPSPYEKGIVTGIMKRFREKIIKT